MRNADEMHDPIDASQTPGDHLSWYIILSKLSAAFGGSVALFLGG
ncbi:MAG: hypothetical protein U0325_28445 [Polyangiales bacterium]